MGQFQICFTLRCHSTLLTTFSFLLLVKYNFRVWDQSNLTRYMDLITDNRITFFCGNYSAEREKTSTLSIFTNWVTLITLAVGTL